MPELSSFKTVPSLTHLKRLTTKDGLVQHADFEVPDPSHGYSLDDNARAVIAMLWHHRHFADPSVLRLFDIYFNYLKKAEKKGGSFHNFLSFTEEILDSEGSEDSVGRAIWALGEVVGGAPNESVKTEAKKMLDRTKIAHHLNHGHVRTKAYILLGLLAAGYTDKAKPWMNKLIEFYRANRQDDWRWFEDSLRYANATLPYALAVAAEKFEDNEAAKIAEESFEWLDSVSRIDGLPAPIGQNGWYQKDGTKAEYDQQPVDTAKMVLAAVALFRLSGKEQYLAKALDWMSWYEGNNSQQAIVTNKDTGGIFDAVTPWGVNRNQGAESIVTYLLAYLSLSNASHN